MAVGVSVRMLAIVAIAVVLSRATAQPAPMTASPGPESDGGGSSSNTAGIVGGLVGGLVGLGILVCFLYMKCIRKSKASASESAPVSQYLKTGQVHPKSPGSGCGIKAKNLFFSKS
ncbi:hypothetical protein Mapa_012334 [Marchantia paleacea]|nr:hypothetical protein Mapa_012334 [Marchantia paleacea]